MIKVQIPFCPLPWKAPKLGKYGAYDTRAPYKRFIRVWLQQQKLTFTPGYTCVIFTFSFTPPASASKKKRDEMLAGKIIPTKSDCTNLQKLYEDCLKGILIEDDRKVAKIFSEKVYGDKEGVDVRIFKLEEFPHVFSS